MQRPAGHVVLAHLRAVLLRVDVVVHARLAAAVRSALPLLLRERAVVPRRGLDDAKLYADVADRRRLSLILECVALDLPSAVMAIILMAYIYGWPI